jgi:hypothetical protein
MSLPLNPWEQPTATTPAPAPDQWVPDPTCNEWDAAAVMDDNKIAAGIDEVLGTDISLAKLIDLLHRLEAGRLSDIEMVQGAQMGIYFFRNVMKWTLAPDNLEHWLKAGGLPDPAVVMDHTPIMNSDLVVSTLCDKHYDVIVGAIKDRLLAPPGTKFPAQSATITGPFGVAIAVDPAESPLPDGGEETLYYESSTLTTNDHVTDLFNAVNAVTLVSQVHVKSEVLYTGGWQVTIDDWQVWFYDAYDWNLGGQSVEIPIKLFDNIPALAPYRSTIEGALNLSSIDPSVLQEIKVTDAQMSQIEGKTISMNGDTFKPMAYPIYSDGSWPFDPSDKNTCQKDTVLTITPP